jgi:hypothetical protein
MDCYSIRTLHIAYPANIFFTTNFSVYAARSNCTYRVAGRGIDPVPFVGTDIKCKNLDTLQSTFLTSIAQDSIKGTITFNCFVVYYIFFGR